MRRRVHSTAGVNKKAMEVMEVMERAQRGISNISTVILAAIAATSEGITIADAREPAMPLLFANQAFYTITGYTPEETIGYNCRFLQGPDTDPSAVQAIREHIDSQRIGVVELLNYRKDGVPFWNRLSLVPVFDGAGEIEYYVGIQSDVTLVKEGDRAKERLHAMRTTVETVNDIVLNFMGGLQYFRMGLDPDLLEEFDAFFARALARMQKVGSLEEYSEVVVAGVPLLNLEEYAGDQTSPYSPPKNW